MKKIFVLTGEPSGDKLASKVIVHLKSLRSDIEYLSVGGDHLKSLEIKSIYDLKEITYIGFTRVLINVFKIKRKIRETVEETGLVLGKKAKKVSSINDKDEMNGITIMSKKGLIPDLAKLVYLGRAITPTFSPIRFHARFFMADAKYITGKIRTTNELVEIKWISLQKAIRLPMADVTEFMINELLEYGGDISKIKKMLNNRPMFTWKMGKQWITRK